MIIFRIQCVTYLFLSFPLPVSYCHQYLTKGTEKGLRPRWKIIPPPHSLPLPERVDWLKILSQLQRTCT
jgi:hypothetical protein